MRYLIPLFFGLVLGPIAAFFSRFLVVGSSSMELETVGIISFKGFPFWFYEGASGISVVSGWHIDRFICNVVFWSIFLGGIALGCMQKSNLNQS